MVVQYFKKKEYSANILPICGILRLTKKENKKNPLSKNV